MVEVEHQLFGKVEVDLAKLNAAAGKYGMASSSPSTLSNRHARGGAVSELLPALMKPTALAAVPSGVCISWEDEHELDRPSVWPRDKLLIHPAGGRGAPEDMSMRWTTLGARSDYDSKWVPCGASSDGDALYVVSYTTSMCGEEPGELHKLALSGGVSGASSHGTRIVSRHGRTRSGRVPPSGDSPQRAPLLSSTELTGPAGVLAQAGSALVYVVERHSVPWWSVTRCRGGASICEIVYLL